MSDTRRTCPYCGAEMEAGELRDGHWYTTTPPKRMVAVPMDFTNEDEFYLAPYHVASGTNCPAWRCAACRKLILDY